MSELSQSDISRILRHFLLTAPPGQLGDVRNDLKDLVGEDALNSVSDQIKTYNIEQFVPIQSPDGNHKFIICSHGQQGDRFADPRAGKTYAIDHVNMVASDPQDLEEVAELKDKRKELEEQLDKYVDDFYHDGVCSVFYSENSDELIACLTAYKHFPSKYWGGRWRSVYRITYEGDKAKVSGTMRINVHYFEDGNVQLNSDYEHGESVSGGGTEAIVGVVRKAEQYFQNNLDNTVVSMNENTFKALRRRLPIIGTLMDFESNAHKLAGDLTNK